MMKALSMLAGVVALGFSLLFYVNNLEAFGREALLLSVLLMMLSATKAVR